MVHVPLDQPCGLLADASLLADCCAAKTRRLHELSIEVLTSYELAEMASISDGYDVGLDLVRA